MAIHLDLETPQGTTASYHRIVESQVNYIDGRVTAQLMSYATREARQAGKEGWMLTARVIVMLQDLAGDDAAPNAPADEVTRAAIYAAVMALPAWAGATDA